MLDVVEVHLRNVHFPVGARGASRAPSGRHVIFSPLTQSTLAILSGLDDRMMLHDKRSGTGTSSGEVVRFDGWHGDPRTQLQ